MDKCPGIRPIGICEVERQIVGKAVLQVLGPRVQQAVGSLQLCTGQPMGIEAGIHAVRKIYAEDERDAILIVDAANAFNSLSGSIRMRRTLTFV